jgi:hypothetical protein
VEPWLVALISVAGTLLGAVIGFGGALKISREGRAEERKKEKRLALANYLAALYQVVGEFRDMPADPPRSKIDDLIDALAGEATTWVRRRRSMEATFGDSHRQLRGQLTTAMANLQLLPLSPELRAAFNEANDYAVRLVEQRSESVKAEWSDVYERLHGAAEKELA